MNIPDPNLELVQRYIDGLASAEETARLQEALRTSEDLRRAFLDYVHLDTALAAAAADRHAATALTQEEKLGSRTDGEHEPAIRRHRWVPRLLFPWFAAAAVIAVGIFVFSSWVAMQQITGEVVASTGGKLADIAGDLQPGQQLSSRRLQLTSGSITLRLPVGVVLTMIAPLDAEFETPMRLRMAHGRLSADVAERGIGFTIVTDDGEVVDLGTRFGVEVDRDGESRVAVFSGQVKVRPGKAAAGHAFTTLVEGEAVRFSALSGLRRWQHVALAAEAAGLVSRSSTAVVGGVRDNLSDDELHPFYGVVREGMRSGCLAFTDKPNPRWAPGPHDRLPAWLEGADLIRTYHQFRHRKDYELVLTLREPATVFVLVDPRQPEPAWLSERFVDTNTRVMVGPWQQAMKAEAGTEVRADALPYLPFAIWRAEAPAGEFKLGAPRDVDRHNTALMYGVAVKARTATSISTHE